MTWELRWHPFQGQWVLFTSHRDARPWIGESVAPEPARGGSTTCPIALAVHNVSAATTPRRPVRLTGSYFDVSTERRRFSNSPSKNW